MTEADYIKLIRSELSADRKAADRLLQRVEEGLRHFPESVRLWCLRGDLIQLSEGVEYELHEALESYKKAVAINPKSLEANEEIGYFYDVVDGDPEKAGPYLRKAVALGGGKKTRKALLDEMRQMQEKKEENREQGGA